MKKMHVSSADQPNKPSADIIKNQIISLFIKKWSESGEIPKSVFYFCQNSEIDEESFYKLFPSLQAVEKTFWKQWLDDVITAISQSSEWSSFSAKDRYLAFLFAMTTASFKYRSLILDRFSDLSAFSNPSFLERLRQSFLAFIEQIISYGQETGDIAPRGNLMKLYTPLLYLHFRFVLSYFINDESDDYQKTDAFIEKTVTLAFDLFRSQAPESASDLIKFLLSSSCSSGESKNSNSHE